MASAAKLEDNLSCSVCFNVFDKPKALPCLHTFCEECLTEHVRKTQKHGRFRCPLCNENTKVPEEGVKGFRDNFLINDLIDDVKQSNMCDVCRLDDTKTPAEKMCIECSDKLCVSCCKSHSKTRVTREHQLVSLSVVKSGKYDKEIQSRRDRYCKEHPNELLKMFCKHCEIPICSLCKIDFHDNHSAIGTEAAMKLTVNDVETHMATVREALELTDKFIGDYEKSRSYCNEETGRICRDISENFERFRQHLSDKENQLLERVKTSGASVLEVVEKKMREIEYQKQMATNALKRAMQLLECESRIEGLTLYKETVAYLKKASDQPIKFQDAKPVFNIKFGEIPDFDVDLKLDIKGLILLQKAEQIASFTTCIEGEDGVNCNSIYHKNDTNLVPDWKNGKVKMYDNGGHLRGLLEDGEYKLKNPTDVKSNDDGDVFVTDNNIHGIVVYDKYLKQKKVIRDVYKKRGRITCDGRRLILSDEDAHVLKIMNMDGEVQSAIDQHTLGLDTFNPYYIDTSPTTGNIIVVDQRSKCVYILDSTGTRVLQTNRLEGKLALQAPLGVSCDSFGHIIVAVGNCLHVISTAGQHLGVIVTDDDKLVHPSGVTISGIGQVSVVEMETGIVKAYKYLDI